MIVCQRCGKENQDHYKFCLGCGAEISSEGESVGMMKTMMADVGSSQQNENPLPGVNQPAGPPPGVGSTGPQPAVQQQPMAPQPMAQPGQQPMGQQPMGQPMGQQPAPQPMAPQPGQPMGQQPMAPQPAAQQPIGPPPGVGAAPGPRACTQCQADIPPNFKFCGVCGASVIIAEAAPAPVSQQAQGVLGATMTLIRPDGSEGGSHTLQEGTNLVGREHGPIFETDGYLSPKHAEIVISSQGNHVRDLGSLNGVFVRMTEEEEIQPGQILRIGQELLRFELVDPPSTIDDGTEIMGSPNPGYWGRITVIIGLDVNGSAYPLLGDSVTMGRERGDINFPDDGYVSGMHARLVARDNKVFLSDMGSSNGTFIKVQGDRPLPNNSYVLLGQQLFRLTMH